jgi:hypothetical protein
MSPSPSCCNSYFVVGFAGPDTVRERDSLKARLRGKSTSVLSDEKKFPDVLTWHSFSSAESAGEEIAGLRLCETLLAGSGFLRSLVVGKGEAGGVGSVET